MQNGAFVNGQVDVNRDGSAAVPAKKSRVTALVDALPSERRNGSSAKELLARYARYQADREDAISDVAKRDEFEEQNETLEVLYGVFGKAVFVPAKIWGRPDSDGNFGSKGAALKGWSSLTYKDTLTPWHQQALWERLKGDTNKLGWAGNIAVLLGEPSDNLVSIDIDDAKWIEPFLEANPILRGATFVNTFRGRQILFRLTGEYPGSSCPMMANGKSIGEFRGGRCLSTIYGHHPKGTPDKPVQYCPSSETVLTLRYDDLVWPEGVALNDSSRAPRKERRSRKSYSLSGKPGSIDTEALREAVETDVEALCAALFPNGKMLGSEFRLADKEGNAPKSQGSLSVQTTGDYAGYWTDWSTGDNGDLIDLVRSVYGVGFEAAVRKIEDILGESFRIPEEETFTLKNSASVRLPSNVNTDGSERARSKIGSGNGYKPLAGVIPFTQKPALPELQLPQGDRKQYQVAEELFSALAKTKRYVVRDQTFYTVDTKREDGEAEAY